MIRTASNGSLRESTHASEKLRPHFLSLARQVNQWSDRQPPAFSVGVTSIYRKEGKSTVAFNLASALASLRSRPVLLVEADFGNPLIGHRLLDAGAPGLSEVIRSAAELDDCIVQTPIPQLSLLSCGTQNGKDVLEAPIEAVGVMNKQLADQFALAIYDLPVASDLNHSLNIARQLDGLILVVEPERIDASQVHRLQEKLRSADTQVIGVVLNKAR